MPDKQIISLLLAFSVLGSVLVSQSFKDSFRNGNIDISLTENEKMITVTASYPKTDSKRVHLFVQEHLELADLPDLSHVEVKQYDSPDGLLHIHIKSRNGYLKVAMWKDMNTISAQERIRSLSKGLQKVLAGN